jgi:predicted nucleic acid-binding protein
LKIYADPSFLVSLYIPDANSAAALRTMRASSGDRFVTALCELEVANAFGLRVFRKQASQAEANAALSNFEKDLHEGLFQLRGLAEPVFERAKQLSQQTTAKLGTRSADLLHVAAALELGVDYFYSFDQQQRKLAQTVRLKLN